MQPSPKLLALMAQAMPLLLLGEHPALSVLQAQYALSQIGGVEFTGAGVFVHFEVPSGVPLCDPPSMSGGSIHIELAGVRNGAGCALFVREGRLSMFEGFTYGDEWPMNPDVVALREAVPIKP